jgi:hypothetical protein
MVSVIRPRMTYLTSSPLSSKKTVPSTNPVVSRRMSKPSQWARTSDPDCSKLNLSGGLALAEAAKPKIAHPTMTGRSRQRTLIAFSLVQPGQTTLRERHRPRNGASHSPCSVVARGFAVPTAARIRSAKTGRGSAEPSANRNDRRLGQRAENVQAGCGTARSPGFTVRTSTPTSSTTRRPRDPAGGRVARLLASVRPQVAAADAGARDAHDGVGRLDRAGLGAVLDAAVPGAEQDSGARRAFSVQPRRSRPRQALATTTGHGRRRSAASITPESSISTIPWSATSA